MIDTPTPEEMAHDLYNMLPDEVHETSTAAFKRAFKMQRDAGRREAADVAESFCDEGDKSDGHAMTCDFCYTAKAIRTGAALATDDQEADDG